MTWNCLWNSQRDRMKCMLFLCCTLIENIGVRQKMSVCIKNDVTLWTLSVAIAASSTCYISKKGWLLFQFQSLVHCCSQQMSHYLSVTRRFKWSMKCLHTLMIQLTYNRGFTSYYWQSMPFCYFWKPTLNVFYPIWIKK